MKSVANWLIRFVLWYVVTLWMVSWHTKFYGLSIEDVHIYYFIHITATAVGFIRACIGSLFMAKLPLLVFYIIPFLFFYAVGIFNWIMGLLALSDIIQLNVYSPTCRIFVVVYVVYSMFYLVWQIAECRYLEYLKGARSEPDEDGYILTEDGWKRGFTRRDYLGEAIFISCLFGVPLGVGLISMLLDVL